MNIVAVSEWLDPARMIAPAAIPYWLGWVGGWLLLWRGRPLPMPDSMPDPTAERPVHRSVGRPAVAVVVPARDEAEALPRLLTPLVAAATDGDEVVVVDDHSTDGTGDVARSLGARVVSPPELPEGWLGKPHACWHGAAATNAPVLAFVDADVVPPADLLDRLGAAVAEHPGTVVSVQPWHVPGGPTEHLSVLFNVTALMGVGRFGVLGGRVRPRAAFGPVLALDRATYDRIGGHARPDVRTMHTEDIGIARAVGRVELYTGRPDVRFRMYPGGFTDLVRGWTRSIATGAGAAPWWAALLTLAWVWSLAGGWAASPWFWVTSAVQVAVLARRAGRFSPVVAVLYPVALAVFVVVFVRSLVARALRRDVEWKHRRVAAR